MSIDWSKRKHPTLKVDHPSAVRWGAGLGQQLLVPDGSLPDPLTYKFKRTTTLSPGGERAREALRAGFDGTILKGERHTPEEWETPASVKEAFRSAIDSAIIIETEIDLPKVGK